MLRDTFALSETGSVRQQNEDNYLLDTRLGIFAVADGLGGLPNGKEASKRTLGSLHTALLAEPEQPLPELVQQVNLSMIEAGCSLDGTGFGTTLTVARLTEGGSSAEIVHVGDSSAYHCREGLVTTLTIEHTVATRMAAEQWAEAGEAIPSSAHHTLTQCIGQDSVIEPQLIYLDLREGDRLFLLTDGVTKPLPKATLEAALLVPRSLGNICQNLTFRIEAAGAPDNYTLLGLQF